MRGSALLPLPRSGVASIYAVASGMMDEDITPQRPFSISGTRALIGKIKRLAAPFWGSGEGKMGAWVWTAITFTLALFSTLYAVVISFVQRFFWNALNAKV